ncbi:MAG: polymer-forming cytoskeletal protein [Acidobacteriaceae bacterium]|nr:polymer-forming cytoskeletal protein [Acidobacteriaceae bacterium]
MSAFVWAAALLLLTGTLLALPLLPAIRELRQNSDAEPLNVIQEHAGEIRYFANRFRAYLEPLEPILRESLISGRKASGVMPDGTEYLVLGSGTEALALPLGEKDELCPVLLASATDLTVSSNSTFSRDVYSRGHFVGGINNQYRALLAEEGLHLGAGSSVMRWVHACGELQAETGCKLFGRVSSDCRIRLAPNCKFLRLNAPRIDFDNSAELPHSFSEVIPASATPERRLHDGDFEIKSGEIFHGDLVVRGDLRIAEGAQVFGSVKSGKVLTVESAALIDGSLISAKELVIGTRCLIRGPIISERELRIQAGTQCGAPDAPTTVSATRISVAPNVVVFGTVWAREQGEAIA